MSGGFSTLSMLPSPLSWRVGVHITTFEACSSFTRVTACRVAHLPYISFIARLHPSRFPDSGARKLPSSTNNLLGWVLPPLVICAVEAHTVTAFFVNNMVGLGLATGRTASQLSLGVLRMLSTTRMEMGILRGSRRIPSCSLSAVKIDGPVSFTFWLGLHSRVKEYSSAMPD